MNIIRPLVLSIALVFSLAGPSHSLAAEYVDLVNEGFVHSVIQVNRASDAQVRNADGDWESVPANTPRIQRNRNGEVLGLIVEYAATNFLLNSESPANQSVSLSAGSYTLWMEGSGSVSVMEGTATGTGYDAASDSEPVNFEITGSGTVDVSVSGSVERFQLEDNAFPTTYIPTTSSPRTRAADLVVDEEILWYCECGITVVVHGWGPPAGESNPQAIHINDNAAGTGDILRLRRGSNGDMRVQAFFGGSTSAVLNLGQLAPGQFFSVAFRMDSNGIAASRDGDSAVTDTFSPAGAKPKPTRMDLGSFWQNSFWSAPLRQVRIYKTAKTDAQLSVLSDYSGTIPNPDHPGGPEPITLIEGKHEATPSSSLPKPPFEGTYIDPNYLTEVRRVTDHTQIGADWHRNDYSRRNPFSADSSKFFTRAGTTWYLHDADDWSYSQVDFGGYHSEPHWHGTRSDTVVTLGGGDGDHRLLSRNVATSNVGEIADFFDLTGINGSSATDIRQIWDSGATRVWTQWEGSPSAVTDSEGYPRYWAFKVYGGDQYGLITYDREHDRVLGYYDFDAHFVGDPDHVSMSPSGNYVVASWADGDECSGSPGTYQNPCGMMVFNQDLSSGAGIHGKSAHSDIGYDAAGNDTIVFPDYVEDGEPTDGWLVMVNLATPGVKTPVWHIWEKFDAGKAGTGMHISMKAYDKPGWALISTYNPQQEQHWYADKIFALELKQDPRILNIAHTYNKFGYRYDDQGNIIGKLYYTEVMASVNRDFTKVLFNSNWQSEVEDADTYLIELPIGTIPDAQQ